jgi:hypothetical protein
VPHLPTRGAVRGRHVLGATAVAALATFCVVQDRITAEGARHYVALQREALAGRGTRVTIEQIMRPAIDRSVRNGLMAAGGVAVLGGLAARRRRW